MIREASINDCSRIAEIHVFSWRSAYKDFISMEYLINKLTVKIREEKFYEYFSDIHNNDKNYVFEEENVIKGFMTIGETRDEDKTEETFELHGIYIDPLFQRQKIGTKFVNKCLEEAINRRKKEITLWVFEKNNDSIQFYKKMGFEFDGKILRKETFNENAIRLIKKF
jgi:GNAT superfamily N-acetyltransferase